MSKEMFWELNRCSIKNIWSESCKKSETYIDTDPLKKDSPVLNFKNTNISQNTDTKINKFTSVFKKVNVLMCFVNNI